MKLFSLFGASAFAQSCKRPTDYNNPSSKDHCIGAGGDCNIDIEKWKWHEFQGYLMMPENNEVPVWTQENFLKSRINNLSQMSDFSRIFLISKRRKNTVTTWE